MRISDHFTVEEMVASEIAHRSGIDNFPEPAELANLAQLCEEVLEPLRAEVGPIQVTSGFRCLEVNRRIGSKDTSHHVQGRAADIRVHDMTPLEVCQKILALNLPVAQVIHEYGSWCHVSVAKVGEPPARQALTIDKFGTRNGLHPVR